MRPTARTLLAVTILLGALGAEAQNDALEIQFIGNMAVRLSDGATTLVSDFPYRSGAFGYMIWSLEGIASLEGATALITHEHADHWEPELWQEMDLRVAADPSITEGMDSSRVVPWADTMSIGAATVHPVSTPHTGAHHSYRVSWRGLELYFTGDTERTDELLAQRDLDIAFVSPWLVQYVAEAGTTIDADLVVVYHHRETPRQLPALQAMWVPVRGDVRRIAFP